MGITAERKSISAFIDRDAAERFEELARQTDGGISAALRRMIGDVIADNQHVVIRGVGVGRQIGVRFKDAERQALAAAAKARGTTPANWLRSLALVHLMRRPQWNSEELTALRELSSDIRAIGNNLNQIARALNVAVQSGVYPPHQGGAAREGGILVRHEMRRLAAIMTGNFEYWGLPDEERPTGASSAVERAKAETKAAKERRRSQPRRRPPRFAED